MQFKFRHFVYLVVLAALFSSCSGFEKIRKSSDVNYKLTKANEYYDKKDYQHANELYKELMPIMKSTRNYETLFYRYSYTFYYLKDYVEASYYFKNFTEYFPTSKDAEECEYMSALCLYKFSPKYPLDQTNTIKSLEAMEAFVNKHPKSERLAEANSYIDKSRLKLETKMADAAKLYYNIERYKAATVAYKSVMRTYPESPRTDFYQYMIMRSMMKFARRSITEKQEERYNNAIGAYNELKENFPKSEYLPEAAKLYAEANDQLNKLKNEHK